MLRIDPKLVADEIPVSWNALLLLQSYVVPGGAVIQSCDVTIAVAPQSKVPDPNPQAMLDGAAVVNSSHFTAGFQEFPPGSVVTQKVRGGVAGATYILTFTPVLNLAGVSESEQVLMDVVSVLH